jgi:Xaa-Pro aminopeptidase
MKPTAAEMKELRDACDKADVAYVKAMEAGGK